MGISKRCSGRRSAVSENWLMGKGRGLEGIEEDREVFEALMAVMGWRNRLKPGVAGAGVIC